MSVVQAEFDRKDFQTTRSSIETLLSLQLRNDKNEAAKAALITQFETIDGNLVQQMVSGELGFDEEVLRVGLKHRNVEVRLAYLKKLRSMNQLSVDDAMSLADDHTASIRKAALKVLLEFDQPLSEEEIRKILVKPQGKSSIGILGSVNKRDDEGERCYREFLLSKCSQMKEAALLERVENSSIYDPLPYYALCEKYFQKYATDLREKIDNQFTKHLEIYKNKMVKKYGEVEAASLLPDTSALEKFLRQNLMRKGLDILCRKKKPEDRVRIQKSLRDGFVRSSVDEMEYLKNFGEWDDIPYLIKAENSEIQTDSYLFLTRDSQWHYLIAETINCIGNARLEELLKFDIPDQVFVELIKVCSISKFSDLPLQRILTILKNEKEEIRKACSLKGIQSFNKPSLRNILDNYMGSDEFRYYNVIHWLDFGICMPKKITRKAINMTLSS